MHRFETVETSDALEGADRHAYALGRLLAHLQSIQRAAHGRTVGRTVADRYYALAQTNPRVAFGQALSLTHRAHLSKLRRRRPGLWRQLSDELEEIHTKLPTPLPAHLTLERQGLFALGYYHQAASAQHQVRERVATRREPAQG